MSIFHMLGKFLYGKRYNVFYVAGLKNKKDNEISAFYSEEEIEKYKPKFYFRPVPLLDRSRLELAKFREYFPNYLVCSKRTSSPATARSPTSPKCTASSALRIATSRTAPTGQ